MSKLPSTLDVLIAGAGRCGLAAYRQLKVEGLTVGVVDHEALPGGELRFYPQGDREHLVNIPDVHTRTTVVGVLPPMRQTDPLEVNLSSADGVDSVRVKALLVCTGQLDASRENNRIPGQRPAGVVTPSFVVRALEHGALPGVRPVVYVESDRDLWCAERMVNAGAEIQALLVRDGAQLDVSAILPEPVFVESIKEIRGTARIQSVVYRDLVGEIRQVSCDALVFASGRYGNHFALKGSGVQLNAENRGIWIDEGFRTSIPRVYAAGTCVQPDALHAHSAETGRKAALAIRQDLAHVIAGKEGAVHGH